jgi:hypothetical protein
LIGATHNDQVTFWHVGGTASSGIEQMAETGGRSILQGEIEAAISAGNAEAVILGGGISSPNSISSSFNVSDDFPLVTLVTMVAPSPDWFVGVEGVNLRANDAWIPNLTLELLPYDAGTDSGLAFTSADLDTIPRGTISPLATPFDGTTPLGTFTFRLVPEPSAIPLLGSAGLALLLITTRHRSLRERRSENRR